MTPADKISKQNIHLDCGDYVLRTVTVADASDRWGEWLDEPVAAHMLNAHRKVHTKAEMVKYIASFDQRTHILLGIFKRDSGLLLGISRVDIEERSQRFMVQGLIGEPDYRHKGVSTAVFPAFRDYFFETLGLKMYLATALSHNQPVINYLLKTGFHLEKKIERHVQSRGDGGMLDLCFFTLSAESWRAWKSKNLASVAASPRLRGGRDSG